MYNIGIRTNNSGSRCASTDTNKHYITLIVFVKSWGFPPLQAHLAYTDTNADVYVCNLAFLYILNAVGLSLCVPTQKRSTITILLTEKEEMNEFDCYRYYYYLLHFIALLWETIKAYWPVHFLYVSSINNGT